jgi:hypothetical protein
MKIMKVNPELTNNKNIVTFKGFKVCLFLSTEHKSSGTCTGKWLEGPAAGKWTTVYMNQIKY